jgi:hypothetical protein
MDRPVLSDRAFVEYANQHNVLSYQINWSTKYLLDSYYETEVIPTLKAQAVKDALDTIESKGKCGDGRISFPRNYWIRTCIGILKKYGI